MTTTARHAGKTSALSLSDFRNCHRDETIIVCGCGTSLHELIEPRRTITIGVNDVGRLFTPDYLVVLNPPAQFGGDRYRYVEESGARTLFTQLDLGRVRPPIASIRLGHFAGIDIEQMNRENVLHYTQNSPYVALCLAVYMGARRIGIIGVDFTEHHFFSRTNAHPLSVRLADIDAQYRNLYGALQRGGIEVFNLSSASRLTAFPKTACSAFTEPRAASAGSRKTARSLSIVSYATTPVVGVPAVLARCIRERTGHDAQCVWQTRAYGNGVRFDGDDTIEWSVDPLAAEAALHKADVIIVHNGKVDARHRTLVDSKPVVTMAHNYMSNVDPAFVKRGFPGMVVGQYQATLAEFEGWFIVPNPVPWWQASWQVRPKPDIVTIAYTPSGKHESYPQGHQLYWHGKGYESTMRVLERVASRWPVQIETVRDRFLTHAESLSAKQKAHILIDECVTGSYHRNSLEGLTLGCVVVNGVGLLQGVKEVIRACSTHAQDAPFVFATRESLEAELTSLIEAGPAKLASRGQSCRLWMEQNWDFTHQWERFWQPVIERAIAQTEPRRGSAARLCQPVPQEAGVLEKRFEAAFLRGVKHSDESVSGPGSCLVQTEELRRNLPDLIQGIGVKSLLDVGCGDVNWVRRVELGIQEYVGIDIVQRLVDENQRLHARDGWRFIRRDITRDDLPAADLILCRDLLVHLSFADVGRALAAFAQSGSRYLLTTTFPARRENIDIATGGWRTLNFQLSPFDFPEPLRIINEKCTEVGGRFADKSLALWRMDQIERFTRTVR
ncbi:class I SAM-dependent methyltransferase [Paraburkholderia sp. Tr-20389]|uniref:class I SAM-dependent methyltransferase n=1 Tax=Paraburkholderia sp. Tr-20389 TaxID=2703903 RepID=UPI00197DF53C|nr:class I SAM-dependent methyltransferase [Paraburkholderia sp. Tr-20389]MBN3753666.1 class I SAM-dependent methyltransferase [Paraburkholderia sp. Tr-20389]